MRMICPNCGLGGTAADQYYLKIVRCPGCRKVFRVTEDIAVDPVPQPPVAAVQPERADTRSDADEESNGGESSDELADDPDDTGLKECDVCGFSFSSEFIRVIDGRQICPVCSN